MYENGKGVKQNRSKAKELYGKTCDIGAQLGCENYADLNSKGY
ncbi:TPA: Sel1 repeat protein [Campylobacter fetus subsp. venerealis]|nr:Sel1 repeat protein [Campylobacter fetus subsp. venerealis]